MNFCFFMFNFSTFESSVDLGIPSYAAAPTDIHVDATVPGRKRRTDERMSVIVEVKGNWHRELDSAMQTQLRDRYLKGNSCKNGRAPADLAPMHASNPGRVAPDANGPTGCSASKLSCCRYGPIAPTPVR